MKSLGGKLIEYFEENLEWQGIRYIKQADGRYKAEMISGKERMEWGSKRFVKNIVDIMAHPEED